MPKVYYYIDDESLQESSLIVNNLNKDAKKLIVKPFRHEHWNDEIEFLISNQDKFDGILLDWQLKKNKVNDGKFAKYDAEALAQQLRRLATEHNKLKKDFPILLCSAAKGFKKNFQKDITGHDLFEEVYDKNSFSDKQKSNKIITQFISLAEGYKIMQNGEKLNTLLGLDKESIGSKSNLDKRLLSYLKSLYDNKVPHELARFILNQLIKKSGVLVSEELLAARLGIDCLNSKDWQKLLDKKLHKFSYKGIFEDGWKRWWFEMIENWWEYDLKIEKSLRKLSARDRVELIIKKTKLKELIPAKVISKNASSDLFWTICNISKKPISIDDGLIMAMQDSIFPWQDKQYISIEKALELPKKDISPLEHWKLSKLKAIYEANNKRTRR